jgi:hypothetical protein
MASVAMTLIPEEDRTSHRGETGSGCSGLRDDPTTSVAVRVARRREHPSSILEAPAMVVPDAAKE